MATNNPAYDAEVELLKDSLDQHTEAELILPSKTIVDQNRTLYITKDQDYAGGKPLGNLRDSESIGISPFKGCLLRLSDKKNRIKSFIAQGSYVVADEKVSDTLRDVSNYCLFAVILFMEDKSDPAPIQQVIIGRLRHMAEMAVMAATVHETGGTMEAWSHYWDQFMDDWNAVSAFARGEVTSIAYSEGRMVRYGSQMGDDTVFV